MKGQLLRYSYLWLSIIFCLLGHLDLVAQDRLTIVDENGEPLIGVYVAVDDVLYTTDLQGEVAINMNTNSVVKFNYLGYDDLELTGSEISQLNYQVALKPRLEILEEIIVIGRTDAREIDLPFNVARIKSEKIYSSNAQNSADALALNSNAYVQKSQLGGGSPILRGFEANKVLLVVDGVRMNNAIYRNGHLQNAITIDPSVLDQLEIIYGPGSLIYGSEALGGVVHFRTQTPLIEFDESIDVKHRFNAYTRYNSADQENSIHFDHMLSKKKFGVLNSVSYSKRSDLRTGSRRTAYPDFGKRPEYVEILNGRDSIISNEDPNVQVGTAYDQLDLLQKWVFRPNDQFKFELNVQLSTSGDIPRYDNLTLYRANNLRYAEWYYGPQKRLLVAPKLTWKANNKFFEKSSLILSYQALEESRNLRNLNALFRETQIEKVKVFGLTNDFTKRLAANQKLTYGLDMHYNDVGSTAFRTDIENGLSQADILTRYPSGGSQLLNAGVFVQHNWQNQDSSLIWINGLRWSTQKVDLLYSDSDPFVWPDFFYDGISSTNSALVGISGLNYQHGPFRVKLASGTAFRSPNVDDLAKIRVNGDEITIPNPELTSEKVWNNEITLNYLTPKISFGVTGFYTKLTDAIIRENSRLPNGEPTFISGIDTLIVTANKNAAKGTIQGLSFQLKLNLSEQLSFDQSLNVQSGKAITEAGIKTPLGHIPPSYGRSTLEFQSKLVKLDLTARYNGWKYLEDYGGSVDNPDQATIDGSPSWMVLGLSSQWFIGNNWTFNVALENLADLHYRQFASGLSSAGRHVVIALRYSNN